MRHHVALGAGLAAGAAALALVVSPQIAGAAGAGNPGAGPGTCAATGSTCTSAGSGAGYGARNGTGMAGRQAPVAGSGPMARGRATGAGPAASSTTALGSGTLSSASRATVAAMAEEEKLAHDVYTALAARYPDDPRFSRIAAAETRHLTAMRRVMTAYGITDPTAGKGAGSFATASVQQLYTDLLARATTLDAALGVGRAIENRDIADLDAAMAAVTTAPDVDTVYSHLRAGSATHLRAFGG